VTQPVSVEETPVQVPPPAPHPPVLTHVMEHTEQTLRVTDENGQKNVTVERKVVTWQIGKSVPGDDSTVIRAMFKDDAGGVRVWVEPKPGSPGAAAGLAFLMELPASAVRFTMKTLPLSGLTGEIAADEQDFLFPVDDEPEDPPAVQG
jgi:hypothetical protein